MLLFASVRLLFARLSIFSDLDAFLALLLRLQLAVPLFSLPHAYGSRPIPTDIAFFASTWGPIAWVVTGEIFPLQIRAKAMSLTTASNWLWNFAIGYATPYLVDQSTSGPTGIKAADLGVKVFFIWGSTCVGCWIFTYFCIPETKGLSLEQIDMLYHHTTPRKSNEYRAMMLERNVDVNGDRVDLGRGGHSGVGDDASDEYEKKATVTHSETV